MASILPASGQPAQLARGAGCPGPAPADQQLTAGLHPGGTL
jgi:hypothetical protein